MANDRRYNIDILLICNLLRQKPLSENAFYEKLLDYKAKLHAVFVHVIHHTLSNIFNFSVIYYENIFMTILLINFCYLQLVLTIQYNSNLLSPRVIVLRF